VARCSQTTRARATIGCDSKGKERRNLRRMVSWQQGWRIVEWRLGKRKGASDSGRQFLLPPSYTMEPRMRVAGQLPSLERSRGQRTDSSKGICTTKRMVGTDQRRPQKLVYWGRSKNTSEGVSSKKRGNERKRRRQFTRDAKNSVEKGISAPS